MQLINLDFETRFALNFFFINRRSPTTRERRGASRVGSQLVKFWIQFLTTKDLPRCRQIIFANIPVICLRHGLDFEFVKSCLEQVVESRGIEACVFLEQVYELHRRSPEAAVPSPVLGCALPFLVALVSSALLCGVALSIRA
jgi:hypothetical protein